MTGTSASNLAEVGDSPDKSRSILRLAIVDLFPFGFPRSESLLTRFCTELHRIRQIAFFAKGDISFTGRFLLAKLANIASGDAEGTISQTDAEFGLANEKTLPPGQRDGK